MGKNSVCEREGGREGERERERESKWSLPTFLEPPLLRSPFKLILKWVCERENTSKVLLSQ